MDVLITDQAISILIRGHIMYRGFHWSPAFGNLPSYPLATSPLMYGPVLQPPGDLFGATGATGRSARSHKACTPETGPHDPL